MQEALSNKTIMVLAPVAVASATATSLVVDATRAYGVTFEFQVGAATGEFSVIKVQSATTSGGSYTDVTGAAFAADAIHATSDGLLYAIHIDLRDRNIGEFFKIVLTENATGSTIIGCTARLWGLEEGAATVTARGYAAEVIA